ncbi:MAG TPA: hypothetical protein VL361_27555 [Candidatus Limnocylindrales bacterium]|nr:hypothetical protein [Candidatus Limnocylindrales bacterium]
MFSHDNLIKNPLQRNHRGCFPHLLSLAPSFNWGLRRAVPIPTASAVSRVTEPSYDTPQKPLKRLEPLFATSCTPLKRGVNEMASRLGSAEFHSAISQVFNLHGAGICPPLADWKSAIQQAESLRYAGRLGNAESLRYAGSARHALAGYVSRGFA